LYDIECIIPTYSRFFFT